MFKNKLKFLLVVSLFGIVSCNPKTENTEGKEIIVLAAASLTDVLTELSQTYKDITGVTVIFSFASSGALQTQIESGVPADIFFSAAQRQMNVLEEKGLINIDTRKNLLENKVVLIAPANSTLNIKSFNDIANPNVKKVGLGEPKSVPVGQYSEEILNHLSILDIAKSKAIYGSDVRNVLSWVETGEIDCGIVYETDAKIANNINIITQAPEGSYQRVIYPIAVINYSNNKEEAQKFINYISTDSSMEVFKKYGFSSIN